MDKLERLCALHRLFHGRHTALPLREIVERLECSPATAKRGIRELRSLLNAPLPYDAARGGYLYSVENGEPRYEIPGFWFRADELAALVTLREVIAQLEPGLLGEVLAPLMRNLDAVVKRQNLGLTEVARRIRVISQHFRAPGASFGPAAKAVLSRHWLAFRYTRRTDGKDTRRRVSPQRLTRYRGCWYLDAWCHDRQALRSFALERITDPTILAEPARNLPEAELDAHYAAAYGIFAGPATEIAVLRVAPHRARWVADETWHPRQTGSFREDGAYELRVPYGRPEELILDIQRLGPDVEVVAPPALRAEVGRRLREASAIYGLGETSRADRASRQKKAGGRVRF